MRFIMVILLLVIAYQLHTIKRILQPAPGTVAPATPATIAAQAQAAINNAASSAISSLNEPAPIHA